MEAISEFVPKALERVMENHDCYAGHHYGDEDFYYKKCSTCNLGDFTVGCTEEQEIRFYNASQCDECGDYMEKVEEFKSVVRFASRVRQRLKSLRKGKKKSRVQVADLLSNLDAALGEEDDLKQELRASWAETIRAYLEEKRCLKKNCSGGWVIRCGEKGVEECFLVLLAPRSDSLENSFEQWAEAVRVMKGKVFV